MIKKQESDFENVKENMILGTQSKDHFDVLINKLDELSKDVNEMEKKMDLIKKKDNLNHYSKIIFNGLVTTDQADFQEISTGKIKNEPTNQLLSDIIKYFFKLATQ